MVSFADDTRLYYGVSNVEVCAIILQNDLNSVYGLGGLLIIICS